MWSQGLSQLGVNTTGHQSGTEQDEEIGSCGIPIVFYQHKSSKCCLFHKLLLTLACPTYYCIYCNVRHNSCESQFSSPSARIMIRAQCSVLASVI